MATTLENEERFALHVVNRDDGDEPMRPFILAEEVRIPAGTLVYFTQSFYEIAKHKEVRRQ